MAYNGSGLFQRLFSWAADKASNIKIRADRMDQEMDGFAQGLSNAICRDGQSTITNDIPFNNKKITGLANPTSANDAVNLLTLQNGSGIRNILIDADFSNNQRAFAGGALAAGAYGHDRWKADTGGANYSVSGAVATITSGAIVQPIFGGAIAVSGTYVINWTGTATCQVDGVAKNKGDTFTLTRGTNSTVRFTGGTLSYPQVEFGSIPSTFENRHPALERTLCRFYFMALPTQDIVPYGAASPAVMRGSALLPVQMRVAPTVTVPVAPTLTNATNYTVAATSTQMTFAVTITGSAGQYGIGGNGTIYLDAEL